MIAWLYIHMNLRPSTESAHDDEIYIYPVNMPDPIRKHFGYGQLQPLQPACSQNRPRSCMPDPTSRIHFSSVFPKKSCIILCKTDPDPILVVWSGFGETHLVWKPASVLEAFCLYVGIMNLLCAACIMLIYLWQDAVLHAWSHHYR